MIDISLYRFRIGIFKPTFRKFSMKTESRENRRLIKAKSIIQQLFIVIRRLGSLVIGLVNIYFEVLILSEVVFLF